MSIKDNWDGVYNAVSPNPVNQNKIMELILRNLHKPYFIPNIPKWDLQIILGEMGQILVSSHWVSSNKVLKNGYVFVFWNR